MGGCQSYCTQPRHATKRKDWCCLSVHELCKAPSLTQQKISIRLKTACMFCLLKHDLSHLFRPIICISPCNLSHGGSSLILFKLYSIICAMRRTLDCELSRADHCCRRRAEHFGELLAVTLNCTDSKFFEIYFFHYRLTSTLWKWFVHNEVPFVDFLNLLYGSTTRAQIITTAFTVKCIEFRCSVIKWWMLWVVNVGYHNTQLKSGLLTVWNGLSVEIWKCVGRLNNV